MIQDTLHMDDVARVVMTLRKGVEDLSAYYNSNTTEPSDGFPLYRKIGEHSFQYVKRFGSSRAFLAKNGNEKYIVKYSRKYSVDAHSGCSMAPTLIEKMSVILTFLAKLT